MARLRHRRYRPVPRAPVPCDYIRPVLQIQALRNHEIGLKIIRFYKSIDFFSWCLSLRVHLSSFSLQMKAETHTYSHYSRSQSYQKKRSHITRLLILSRELATLFFRIGFCCVFFGFGFSLRLFSLMVVEKSLET